MSRQPNIILVLCDQLRRSALGVYGDPNVETPNIDRLAREGVRFDNASSTYPICVPFRFTLMTGQYAHTRMIPGIEWRMSPAERTLADEYNEAGYETLYLGKWHLYGGQLHMPGYSSHHEGVRPVPPLYQGRWQHWRGFELRNSPFDTYYFVDDDPTPVPVPGYQTDGFFSLGMELIREKAPADRPFACIISVEPPHPPFEAPEDVLEKWRDRELELPDNFLLNDHDEHRARMGRPQNTKEQEPGPEVREGLLRDLRTYYAMIENLDQNMGRLLDFLEEEKMLENTILLFTSDHGEMLGCHGLRSKQYPYEESCGIPLLAMGCGLPAGRVIKDPVATEDLFPTMLGLCNLTPRDEVPGANAAPLMRGETDSLDRHGVLLEFVNETRPQMPLYNSCYRAFRSERYKYTAAGDLSGFTPWHFYDLQEDPCETNNLIKSADHQEEISRHHRLLRQRMLETCDDAPLAPAYGCEGLNMELNPQHPNDEKKRQ